MPPKRKSDESIDVKQEASIYYEKSITKNLGDYNSAKITVGVTLPMNPTKRTIADIQTAIEIADEIVTEELSLQVDAILKEAGK